MQRYNMQALAAFRRVLAFLDGRDHAVALGTMTPHVDALQAVVRRLEELAEREQDDMRRVRGATACARILRQVLLREYLIPLSTIGECVVPATTTAPSPFAPLRARSAAGLVRHAARIAAAAARHQRSLAAYGVAPEVSRRLRDAITSYRTALDECTSERRARMRTTADIAECTRAGRAVVRILGTLTTARLDAVERGVWRATTRVRRGEGEEGRKVA